MQSPIFSTMTNDLIDSLPCQDRMSFLADYEAIDLVFGEVITEPCGRILHVFFRSTASFP